jgi:hypothetical protein
VWRRRRSAAGLDDVVEYLRGLGIMLMKISTTLDKIENLLGGDDEEEDA